MGAGCCAERRRIPWGIKWRAVQPRDYEAGGTTVRVRVVTRNVEQRRQYPRASTSAGRGLQVQGTRDVGQDEQQILVAVVVSPTSWSAPPAAAYLPRDQKSPTTIKEKISMTRS